eukprot:CAMPEP_0172492228 /NCGR_PEP_ID=MMETSP1066-20121228/23288_1 /TAXON_ID=671091 /ORGANISM="Coscinodiscus wailesii, Strain CCMP2513" /LENGTH=749 /DNA_ID=CAMNT_0013261719 /DNA_START=114 /DNA_END=2363 /DNA_ORIENTATION=+
MPPERRLTRANTIKRKKIYSEPVIISDSFVIPCYPKGLADALFLEESLSNNVICDFLTDDDVQTMINAMQKQTYASGEVIIEVDTKGDYFYVIESGSIRIIRRDLSELSLSSGAAFGELALLYNCPRNATCQADGEVVVWRLDRKTFQHMMAKKSKDKYDEVLQVLKKVPFLSSLGEKELMKVANGLNKKEFKEGTKIVTKGEIGTTFYIVSAGEIKLHDIGLGDSQFADQLLKGGDFFGERALLTGEPRAANVTAASDCTLLCMSKEDFNTTLGDLDQLIKDATRQRILMGIPVFAHSNLKANDIQKLTSLFESKIFQEGEYLEMLEQELTNQGIYIVEEGSIRVMDDDGVITDLTKGDHIGGQTIKWAPHTKSNRTVQFLTETKCCVLTKDDIESVIVSVKRLGRSQSFVKELSDVDPDDITICKDLGSGSFGNVSLVYHKTDEEFYALKEQKKQQLVNSNLALSVIREKNIMASIKHPFIINLVSTFQTQDSLYMMLGVIQGGELYDFIYPEGRDPGIPDRTWIPFYTACIFESLSHCHSLCIAYRDLKPENIMLDKFGYCVLIDFGFAKVVMDKTFTMCGTPEYLAPEVLLQKGYNQSVDDWGLAILIYEMFAGHTPFYKTNIGEMDLFRGIVRCRFGFPSYGEFTPTSRDIISKVLMRNPAIRLGGLAHGNSDIRNHEYFASIDWEKLLKREYEAPYLPEVEDYGEIDVTKGLSVQQTLKRASSSSRFCGDQELFEKMGKMNIV